MMSATTKIYSAQVLWFDPSSGEGQVELDCGLVQYVHYSCIVGVAKNGYHAPTLDDQALLGGLAGRRCAVTLYINLYSTRVESMMLVPGGEYVIA